MSTTEAAQPGTIVLIHGLWVTPLERDGARGYRIPAGVESLA